MTDPRFVVVIKDRKMDRTSILRCTSPANLGDRIRSWLLAQKPTPWTPRADTYILENYHKYPASFIARALRSKGYRSVTKNMVIGRYHQLQRTQTHAPSQPT